MLGSVSQQVSHTVSSVTSKLEHDADNLGQAYTAILRVTLREGRQKRLSLDLIRAIKKAFKGQYKDTLGSRRDPIDASQMKKAAKDRVAHPLPEKKWKLRVTALTGLAWKLRVTASMAWLQCRRTEMEQREVRGINFEA
jgi:hypothetical protein